MKKNVLVLIDSVILVACLLLAASRPAHAYLDPGAGSYALQVGVAGLFGALFSLKLFWGRITGSIRQAAGTRVPARNADRSRTSS